MGQYRFADRVKESTTTTGTGNVTLDGAVSNYSTFASRYANGETFYYAIIHQSASEWEVGYGTFVSATPAVARTKVISSTNSDAAVSFSSGTKHVFITVPSQAMGINGVVDPLKWQARISAAFDAAPATDVTAATTVYLMPYNGNRISLFNGSFWKEYTIDGSTTTSLSGLIKGVTYDLFVKDTAGVPTFVAYAWKTVVAGNSPTAGSSKVINLSTTSDLSVGQRVTVKDGSNSEVAYITSLVTNTSITVDTLANSYTTPNVYGYRVREPGFGLVTQDGVWVSQSTGDKTERYAGSITISAATTGQTEDSNEKRLVYNAYNQIPRPMLRKETTNTWVYSSSTIRQANNSRLNQLEFTNGLAGAGRVDVSAHGLMGTSTSTLRGGLVAVGDNSITQTSGVTGTAVCATSATGAGTGHTSVFPPTGFNFFAWLEAGAGTDTQTHYGDNNAPADWIQSGIVGTWSC